MHLIAMKKEEEASEVRAFEKIQIMNEVANPVRCHTKFENLST
jgi:hypothetical protein